MNNSANNATKKKRELFPKSPARTPSSKKHKKNRKASILASAAELDTISMNLSTTSKELLTPPPIKNLRRVSNTVAKRTPTGLKISCETTVPGTEEMEVIENSMQLKDSDETKRKLAKIHEDIDMAIIFVNTLHDKLVSIQKDVATEAELCEFNETLHEKLRIVSKVAQKGVSLKRVDEYRVVAENTEL